jgi:glutamyl-tRNA synthetase
VIDDFDFGITHIVRGEDHVTNTAAQIQMFEALGGKAPQFAHLPLLTGKEGKLSKRLGSLGVRELRAEGIENMAICAFLAKLGTSEAIEPWDNLEDLAQSLDFSKLGRSQPKFDEEELKLFNHKVVRQLKFAAVKDRLNVSEEFWEAIKGNLNTVKEAEIWQQVCFNEVTPVIEDKDLCDKAAAILSEDLTADDAYANWTNALKQSTGKKGKDLFHPLRLALTGLDNGPELKVLLRFIGYNKAKSRLLGQKA